MRNLMVLLIAMSMFSCGQPYYFDKTKCDQAFATTDAQTNAIQANTTLLSDLQTSLASAPIKFSQRSETRNSVTTYDADAFGTVYANPADLTTWCGFYLFRLNGGSPTAAITKVEEYKNYLDALK